MAVAPLLPTMTTVGSVLTIGSPAVSSDGGSRPGLEQGGELKVATERRRRRCAFGSKLSHGCWRGGASRPPGAIRSAMDSSLRRGAVAMVLPWSQVGRPLSWHPCTWAAPLCPGETCPNRHARILRTPYATSTATGSSGFFHTPWKAQLTSGCEVAVLSAMTSDRHSRWGLALPAHDLLFTAPLLACGKHPPRWCPWEEEETERTHGLPLRDRF